MNQWKNPQPAGEQIDSDTNEYTYLLFVAGGELYGTKITDVREVIAPQTPKPVSDTNAWVKGIMNLRGEVLVVIDLRKRLAATEYPSKSFMVIESEKGPIALIVDRIHAVRAYKVEEIHERTHLQVNVRNEHFIGIGKFGEETAILLDLRKVFTENELIQLDSRKTGS